MEVRYQNAVGNARQEAISVGDESAVFGAVVHFAANVSLLVVLAVGGEQVMSGALSPGSLSSFLMYSLYLGFASSALSSSFAEFQRASGATERLLALSDRKSAMPPSQSGVMPAGAGPHAVVFDNVTFSYPSRRDAAPALDGFDLNVAAGECVAIMGASGCGKSTLLRLVSRLYDVDSGLVTVGGVDVKDLDASFRGGLVGVVPQEPVLLSGTIAENIQLGCARPATDGEVAEAARRAGLDGLLARLPDGLATAVGEAGVQLSGGEKQRVAIARLFLNDPPVVLLDEFSSALDERTMLEVASNLSDALVGKTVVAVAHNDQVLEAIGVDRVVDLTKE